jgi:hypothetical protein
MSHVHASIDRHFGARITAAEERAMRAHLSDCAVCRAYYERRMMLAALDPRAASPKERHAQGLGLARPAARSPVLFVAPALAACALALFVALPADDFVERGAAGQAAELVVYRVNADGPPELVADTIAPGDELAFAVRNPRGRARLLLFAVDEHGHISWFHPAWLVGQAPPAAIAAPRGAELVELPGAVRHDWDGARLEIVLLLTDEERSVVDVERALAGAAAGELAGRAVAGAEGVHLSLAVRPR